MLDGNIIKPDFLIIGAPRSGTSWLWEMLKQHPGTDLPKVKEPFFFGASEIYEKGFGWYFSLFSDIDPTKITGEGSTSNFYDKIPYFYNEGHELKYNNDLPVIPELITNALPNIKIIICLRDPVDRAISHFGLWLGQGMVSPFAGLKKPATTRRKLRIIEYGHYAKYLELWQKYVPPERMHIIVFEEDIVKNPLDTLEKVYSFLDLESGVEHMSLDKKINKTKGWSRILLSYYLNQRIAKISTKKPISIIFDLLDKLELVKPMKISKEEIEFLRKMFISEKSKIEKLINRNLDCWKYGCK